MEPKRTLAYTLRRRQTRDSFPAVATGRSGAIQSTNMERAARRRAQPLSQRMNGTRRTARRRGSPLAGGIRPGACAGGSLPGCPLPDAATVGARRGVPFPADAHCRRQPLSGENRCCPSQCQNRDAYRLPVFSLVHRGASAYASPALLRRHNVRSGEDYAYRTGRFVRKPSTRALGHCASQFSRPMRGI